MKIIDTKRQYDRVHNKTTHAKMLQPQILQHKNGRKNFNQSKDKIKGSSMVMVVILTLYLKEKIKQGQQILYFPLKYLVKLDTRIFHQIIVTGTFLTKVH